MKPPRRDIAGPALTVLQGWAGAARRQGEREWFGNPLHRMLLARPLPEGFAANPRDRRPTNPAEGRRLLAGIFDLAGTRMNVGAGGDPFDKPSPDRAFAVALHRMGWLHDLLTQEEEGARAALRLVADWRRVFGRWNGFSWGPTCLERRVFNLACAARRLSAVASDAERALLAADLVRQARHLAEITVEPERALQRMTVVGIAGCALAGEAGEQLIDKAMSALKRDLPGAVASDGVHASRSPEAGLELLFDLMTLDEALHQKGQAGPDEMNRAIDRLSAATRFFTLPDGRLASFQGGEAVGAQRIAAALAHEEDAGPPPLKAPHGGYYRLDGAGLSVILDGGAAAKGVWSATACAQTLAIEILAGQDRLVTGCAWSPDAAAPQALRLTDGASTASLADGSAGEPLRGLTAWGVGPRLEGAARQVEVRRHDAEAGVWLECSHDGWAPAYGLIHDRRLYLDLAAGELRGEDAFRPMVEGPPEDGPRRYLPFKVRFHLHPDARASLARDGKSVLLRGPSDQGWWLRNDAIEVSIEPSAHFEHGRPRRSSQVVLTGQVRVDVGGRIRWKMSRAEG
ncbi:heparinase [Caulobacter sp. SLTY]|uniref:heparinase II/III domain-containing protein n=1 Tax=Caulobacter sp. SLTY TaxID=2683262 RepID=UPI0014126AB4|nr:heparinase [Caulobacter sp. SLTY]